MFIGERWGHLGTWELAPRMKGHFLFTACVRPKETWHQVAQRVAQTVLWSWVAFMLHPGPIVLVGPSEGTFFFSVLEGLSDQEPQQRR